MWIILYIALCFSLQGRAWPSKRDVELFGLKFKNPANMGTMTGSSTGTQNNPANFAATLTGTGSQQNPGNISPGTSSSGSSAHQKNPANFAATLTGPGSSQNTSGSGSSSGGSGGAVQNPANFASTLTGSGGTPQNPVIMGTGSGNGASNNVPGDMTGVLDKANSKYGSQGGYVQHQNHDKPDFNFLNAGNNHLPGKCINSHPEKCSMSCQEVDSVTGCIVCNNNCQITSSAVTASTAHATTSTTTQAPTALSGVCPPFPVNCPRGSFAISNGCPVCTALQTTTVPSTSVKVTTHRSTTCGPVRCVAPCNKGIRFDASRCPVCVC